MNNYFDNEIKRLEKEILWLKTTKQKSAGLIEMVTKTIPISIKLEVDPTVSVPSAVGQKYYKIKNEEDAILIPTLDWYYEDVYNAWRGRNEVYSRYLDLEQIVYPDGYTGVRIRATGTNVGANSDGVKVAGGETIRIECNLTVRSSADFSIEEV